MGGDLLMSDRAIPRARRPNGIDIPAYNPEPPITGREWGELTATVRQMESSLNNHIISTNNTLDKVSAAMTKLGEDVSTAKGGLSVLNFLIIVASTIMAGLISGAFVHAVR
jgi:hypothetical protein